MILQHLRSNAVAYLALTVAMSGTSYAVSQLPNGSVTTAKLAQNAVTSPKIKDHSVGASDLAAHAVRSSSVKNGSLTLADVAKGVIPLPILIDTESSVTLTPAAMPDGTGNDDYEHTVTLPRTGRVLISFSTDILYASCTSGVARAGVYLDSSPVPKTGKPISSDATSSDPSFETSAVVDATKGVHKLRVLTDCPTGDQSSFGHDEAGTWTVIQP